MYLALPPPECTGLGDLCPPVPFGVRTKLLGSSIDLMTEPDRADLVEAVWESGGGAGADDGGGGGGGAGAE